MKATIYVSIASLFFAFGCNKKSEEPQPTTEPSAVIAAPSAVATPEPAPVVEEDSDIEVPEDFTDEAAQEITEQNLDSEVAALEKEINSDT